MVKTLCREGVGGKETDGFLGHFDYGTISLRLTIKNSV